MNKGEGVKKSDTFADIISGSSLMVKLLLTLKSEALQQGNYSNLANGPFPTTTNVTLYYVLADYIRNFVGD